MEPRSRLTGKQIKCKAQEKCFTRTETTLKVPLIFHKKMEEVHTNGTNGPVTLANSEKT
jgi:hypothetical protein